jgi:Group II intron, maturase-specific domain
VLTRLNQIMRGRANYFRDAVAKDAFSTLDNFAWWRVIRMLTERHHWRWERRPPPLHRPRQPVAAGHGGRDRVAEDNGHPGHPAPLPRRTDPQPPGSPSTTPDGRNHGEFVARRRARRVIY